MVQAEIVAKNSAHASPSRPHARLNLIAVAFACVIAVIFEGDFTRPIWIDEFVQFAFGSLSSTGEALNLIFTTVTGVNRGQTGVYFLLDYWLLHIFGASAVALRMPSLLSGLLLFGGGAAVLRARGFGLGWQLFAVVSLVTHSVLMSYVSEGRSYMPLAAASMGTLAYYLFPLEERSRPSLEALGGLSIMTGVMMHPYFSVYWLAVFAFAHVVQVSEGTIIPGWRSLLHHVNVPLSVVGAVIYFIIAALTWLRGGPIYVEDPFLYINPSSFLYILFVVHAQDAKIVFILGVVTVLGSVVVRGASRTIFRALLPPVILFLLALILSAFVSYVSYRAHYWILQRQWIASLGLATVAVVWFWAVLWRCAAKLDRRAGWVAIAIALVATSRIPIMQYQTYETHARDVVHYFFGTSQRTEATNEVPDMTRAPSDNDGWVALANRNIQIGGPVWPIFRYYYYGPTAWGASFRVGSLDRAQLAIVAVSWPIRPASLRRAWSWSRRARTSMSGLGTISGREHWECEGAPPNLRKFDLVFLFP